MKRDDWIGLSVSVLMHAVILLGLSFLTMGAVDPTPIGFVEVEFGEFAEGRPVSRAPQSQAEQTPQPADETEPTDPQPAPAPREARPVDLPDQVVADAETVQEATSEVVAPEQRPESESELEAEQPSDSRPIRPLGSGDPEGDDRTQEGQEGAGADETRSAPYQIEGLNRIPVATVTPRYASEVNADIAVQITVDPQGRVIGSFPLRKADARLEQAVSDALARWRFNPLPPGAPQVNQSGRITFRFRLN
jgi:protein TonB